MKWFAGWKAEGTRLEETGLAVVGPVCLQLRKEQIAEEAGSFLQAL